MFLLKSVFLVFSVAYVAAYAEATAGRNLYPYTRFVPRLVDQAGHITAGLTGVCEQVNNANLTVS